MPLATARRQEESATLYRGDVRGGGYVGMESWKVLKCNMQKTKIIEAEEACDSYQISHGVFV